MAHFTSYNTSDPSTGNIPLQKEETKTFGPMQTDRAQNIGGSIFADQSGVLKVQQSFDNAHWDISQSITVKPNEGQGFNIAIIAPNVQLVYENGTTNQTVMRLFARTFVTGN